MAAIFHHALEVGMRLSAGRPENIATAWPFLDVMLQAFVGQDTQHQASIQSLQTQIKTLEEAAIAADNAKAIANAAKAVEVKEAVRSATKKLIDTKATEVETAVSTAKASAIEASHKHMIELVASKTVLKHLFDREMRMWNMDNIKTSTDAASKVLMGLLGSNVDTSARLCGASTSDIKILQQRANELVQLTRVPTSVDIAQFVGMVSEALPSRPSLISAATGPGNIASTQTHLPREDTSPFARHTSKNSGQPSQLGRSYEATELTATSPEIKTLVLLLKRWYRTQYSNPQNVPLSTTMGEKHAIMFYNHYAWMIKKDTSVNDEDKIEFIKICIIDLHDGILKQEDEKLVKRTLAQYSRAEISDFNSK